MTSHKFPNARDISRKFEQQKLENLNLMLDADLNKAVDSLTSLVKITEQLGLKINSSTGLRDNEAGKPHTKKLNE